MGRHSRRTSALDRSSRSSGFVIGGGSDAARHIERLAATASPRRARSPAHPGPTRGDRAGQELRPSATRPSAGQARALSLGWPLLRRIARRLGDTLHTAGVIAAAVDVFFLSHAALTAGLAPIRRDCPTPPPPVARRGGGSGALPRR